ncbi:hypothetical protein PhCBS80983_g02824 [Powellomyces hirtus]|uniref:Timeless N-terminal domain-containing protein n=1 Tax=Powellomyces hirtus TaxID=109895 RepID=A0A507E6F6_9FUNG|nr:hypothetical protein PhCBS80983_g02824 [Powellomyces hirtus]
MAGMENSERIRIEPPAPPPPDSNLLSICAALGGFEVVETYVAGVGNVSSRQYVMGDETLACLRDLKRLLRNDEQSKEKEVARSLGRWNILQTDLVPILLAAHAEGKEKIAQAVVQLFVPLTWPIDTKSHDAAGQQEIQRGYKEVFLQESVLSAVLDLLLKPLSVIHRERTERDHAFIGLILTLFRNLLAIRDTQTHVLSTGEKYIRSTLQEHLIISMSKTDIIPLLLSFAGSLSEREYSDWNLTIMEVFYYLFLERDPEEMFRTAKHGSTSATRELGKLLLEEEAQRRRAARIPRSRHSRFGGTLTFKLSDGQTFNAHNLALALNSPEETLDVGKSNKLGIRKTAKEDEYQKSRAIRSREAAKVYVSTATAFLENCFNEMVESVKRDFAAEKDKVQEDHYARFMWLCAFILKFQRCAMRDNATETEDHNSGSGDPPPALLDFDTITGFLDIRGVAFVTGRISQSIDEKRMGEVSVGVECLKQMLLTLDAMASSPIEDFRDVSLDVQNNMYYEHSTIDIAISLVREYKQQIHLSHLKAVVEVIHVLLKMLEEYSKTKSVVFRKKAPKKKKPARKAVGPDEDNESDNDVIEDVNADSALAEVKETELSFTRIVSRFASDTILNNYYLLLKHYLELDARHIYYITVMFHRIFLTADPGAPLFYKLSILHLFNKILKDRRVLPATSAHRELYAFITFMLNRFFKKAKEYPILFVEILFPKTKGDCVRIQFGNEVVPTAPVEPKEQRPDKEIEIVPGLSWTEEVQVAVELLLERDQESMIHWVAETLMEAATQRDPPPPPPYTENEEEDDMPPPLPVEHPTYDVRSETDEITKAMRCNAAFRLLLRLLSFQEVDAAENEAVTNTGMYQIPGTVTANELLAHRDTVLRHVKAQKDGDGLQKDLLTMVRKKRKPRRKHDDGSEPTRRMKKPGETMNIKSAAYISDSDEGSEADAAFFESERQLKAKMAEMNGMPQIKVSDPIKRKAKAKSKLASTPAPPLDPAGSNDPGDQEDVDSPLDSDSLSGSDSENANDSDGQDGEVEQIHKNITDTPMTLEEAMASITNSSRTMQGAGLDVEHYESSQATLTESQKRRKRTRGFVLSSDEDDDEADEMESGSVTSNASPSHSPAKVKPPTTGSSQPRRPFGMISDSDNEDDRDREPGADVQKVPPVADGEPNDENRDPALMSPAAGVPVEPGHKRRRLFLDSDSE